MAKKEKEIKQISEKLRKEILHNFPQLSHYQTQTLKKIEQVSHRGEAFENLAKRFCPQQMATISQYYTLIVNYAVEKARLASEGMKIFSHGHSLYTEYKNMFEKNCIVLEQLGTRINPVSNIIKVYIATLLSATFCGKDILLGR